jgi:asparagine synthase (glutamine-hydrolysing)
MKIQFGSLYLDGRPVTPLDAQTLLGDLCETPAEISGLMAEDSVTMLYRGQRITPEEDFEDQPLRIGWHTLTWDGRLDNREELASRLGVTQLQSTPDPLIVLKAYIAFGKSVFADLVGEFALTLWCRRTKSLLFARSSCGARPLYYVIDKNKLTWSSDFAHLVRVTGVDLTVNDDYVIEYMVSLPSTNISPLSTIEVVPSNRVIQFNGARLTHTQELWNPTHVPSLVYHTDGEYEEHLREVLKEAVRVRLRSKRPAFAELSGGLDSSTITLLADQVLRSQNRSTEDLQTTSCVYERSQTCDESPFIRVIEEKRGIDSHLVHEKDLRTTLGLDEPEFVGLPNPLHCFPGRYPTIAKSMAPFGARLLLTGGGGDHLFWSEANGTPIVADYIRDGNLLRAHGECRTWSQAASGSYYDLLLKKALPLALENWFPAKSRYKRPELPGWLHPRLQQRLLSITPSFTGYTSWRSTPSKRAQVFFLELMFRYLGSGFLQEYSDLFVSHPYSHRPLVEFCLGTPISQFLRNGETRSLMRRAFHDLLPRKTVRRTSKGLLDESFTRALQKEWRGVSGLNRWEIFERGYVALPLLWKSLTIASIGLIDQTGPLFRLFSLERWLRSLGHARSNVTRNGLVCGRVRDFSCI